MNISETISADGQRKKVMLSKEKNMGKDTEVGKNAVCWKEWQVT
jgi:hypothetical protein